MRDQYQFNKNYKDPDKKHIEGFMDFDAVLRESKRRTEEASEGIQLANRRKSKNPVLLISAIAASLILVAVVLSGLFSDTYFERQAEYFAEQSYVNPPDLNAAKPSFASYKIPAYDGGIIEHTTGSRITIPKEAFEYNNGEIVTGNVDIIYREFHDFIDFFLSGVPMTYDSLGQTYNLESAGMIEIFAEQGGQRINMRPGKSIDVELVSVVEVADLSIPPSFNIYKLNEEERKWVYTDIDNIEYMEVQPKEVPIGHIAYEIQKSYFDRVYELDQLQKELLEKVNKSMPLPKEPVRPTQQREDALVFNFDLKNQLREAAPALFGIYKDALWQLHPSEKVQRAELDHKWEDLELVQLNELDFKLTLLAEDKSQTILINPLLVGPAFQEAMNNYSVALDNYSSSMESWEERVADRKDEIFENINQQKALAQNVYKEELLAIQTSANKSEIEPLVQRTKVVNKFKANELGIWNCDRPVLPEVSAFTAKFKLPNGKVLNNVTGYMACKGQNTVHKFLVDRKTPLQMDLTKDYLIWLVLPQNRIAVLKPKDIKNINPTARKHQFTLSMIEETDLNEAKLRSILTI